MQAQARRKWQAWQQMPGWGWGEAQAWLLVLLRALGEGQHVLSLAGCLCVVWALWLKLPWALGVGQHVLAQVWCVVLAWQQLAWQPP